MDFHNPDSLYQAFFQMLRFYHHRIHTLLDKIDLYPGQPIMLYALHQKDGQSQKELAEKLIIKPATVTVMLKRMEKAALVERIQDPDDQRVSRVYLTEKGKEIFSEVKEFMKIVEAECFADFTEEEQEVLFKFFMKMRDNLSKACDKK